jgi:hypothetical protein
MDIYTKAPRMARRSGVGKPSSLNHPAKIVARSLYAKLIQSLEMNS